MVQADAQQGGVGRYENIDALRGIAAMLVVILHASEVYVRMPQIAAYGTWLHDIASFLEAGRAGVIAFFAISGFVVASTIKPPKLEGTGEFVIKRFFRLYPAYWIALALTYLAIWLPISRPVTVEHVAASFTMMTSVFGFEAALGHFWTLEIEFVFYCAVVVLFLTGKLTSPRLLVTLVCLLSIQYTTRMFYQLTWAPGQGHWSQLPQCLAIMLWGSLLRQSYDPDATAREKLRAWNTVPIIIATLFVYGRALGLGALFKQVDLHTWLSGLGTLWGLLLFVLVVLSGRGWPRWTVWLGTISYSLYLLHPVVLHPLNLYLQAHPDVTAPVWLLVLLVAAVTVAASSATYILIEAPCNTFAAKLARRWRNRVAGVRVGAPEFETEPRAAPERRVVPRPTE